jgi:sugar lactone lactonase YvrE
MVLAPALGEPTLITSDGANAYWIDYYTNDLQGCGLKFSTCPSPLVQSQTHPKGIATDGTHLYWSTGGGSTGNVMACTISNCSATAAPLVPSQNGPGNIAVDATNVYWINTGDGTVNQIPKTGGTITPLGSGQSTPNGIAVDSSGLYWTNSGDGMVMRYSFGATGTNPAKIAINQVMPLPIVLDQTYVYWVAITDTFNNVGAVVRLAK